MEKNTFLDIVQDAKNEIIAHIGDDLLKAGTIHVFANPPIIHYYEGEVFEPCKLTAIEVNDKTEVLFHIKSESTGENSVDDPGAVFYYLTEDLYNVVETLERELKEKKNDAPEEIINTLNSHNPELVDAINRAWNENKEAFEAILFAFCIRDEQEIKEKFGGYCPQTSKDALNFAHEIMENVCDDMDLECILKFLRKDNPEQDINITWKKPGKAFVFIFTSDYPGDVGVSVSDLTEDPDYYGLSEEEANEISALSVGESTSNFDYNGCIAVRIQ